MLMKKKILVKNKLSKVVDIERNIISLSHSVSIRIFRFSIHSIRSSQNRWWQCLFGISKNITSHKMCLMHEREKNLPKPSSLRRMFRLECVLLLYGHLTIMLILTNIHACRLHHISFAINFNEFFSSPIFAHQNCFFLSFFSCHFQLYTNWANHYLEKVKSKRRVTDLAADCRDGLLLADVVEGVTSVKVPDLIRKPKAQQQMVSWTISSFPFLFLSITGRIDYFILHMVFIDFSGNCIKTFSPDDFAR